MEAEKVSKGVFFDNLMLLSATDTIGAGLGKKLAGNNPDKMRQIASSLGTEMPVNAVQEMGQTIIPKAESGQDWSVTDPDVLLSGVVGALGAGIPLAGQYAGARLAQGKEQEAPKETPVTDKGEPSTPKPNTEAEAVEQPTAEGKPTDYGFTPQEARSYLGRLTEGMPASEERNELEKND